ncbi:Hsp20/alpha crystallin family protein [Methanolobus profundi]|uniref:HSP20 family protein n=1 Tax=Methanolobus profundi TaxID=487685 RepID=A0A1I4PJD1_9EURY|nr:Hsp20 family protein [Methanolobus profundi]SFM27817.1 HSP20 family protein [Methanolobus profundi]
MNDKDHYSSDDDSQDKITSIDELIEHIMEMFANNIGENDGKPVIQGFTIINQPGKKPFFFGFKGQGEPGSVEYEDEGEGDFYIFNQEPFIDVSEAEDQVILLADLGVEEEEIEYYPYASHVELSVITSDTGYSRVIDLPCDVDPESMVASYRNGVLELTFLRAAATE